MHGETIKIKKKNYFDLFVFISDNVPSDKLFISKIIDTEFVYSQK